MANPLLIPGVLNRVRGSIIVAANPNLNVTAAYLGKEGITIAPENDITTVIPAMASTVNSSEPYQLVTITANIVKSLSLSKTYINQWLDQPILGQIVMNLDTDVMPTMTIENASIVNWSQLSAAGTQADFAVTFKGFYVVSNSMWDLTA